MKTLLKSLVTGLLALALTAPAAFAQDRRAFSQAELDQMLAPIALYPDALLSQILMAATYPVEVVHAARWSRANTDLTGQDAVQAVEPMDWDPSVKSLTAFPQMLYRMDQSLGWTERLGEAFIVQEAQVMDTIQGLRHRAAIAGNLGPSDQMRVTRDADRYVIEPADPQVVYVPYYNPVVVYGTWWWPEYQPVYWAPWPGYHVRTPYAPAYLWDSGVAIRIGFFFGHFDWPRRHVTVVHHHSPKVVVHEHTTIIHRPHAAADPRPVRWQHDPKHRRSAPHRNAERREPGPAHAVSAGGERRPGGARDSARPESRSAHQLSPRAQPAAHRTSTRRSDGALDREDREARRPVAAAAPAARSAGDRRDAGRPAAALRDDPPAAPPSAPSDNAARPDRAAPDRSDQRVRRSAAIERDDAPSRQERASRRPAPGAADRSAAAVATGGDREARSGGERRDAGRSAATAREDAPGARSQPSTSRSARRAANGQHRAEAREGDLALRPSPAPAQ